VWTDVVCGCGRKVDGRANAPEVTDVPVARFTSGRDLVSKGNVRV